MKTLYTIETLVRLAYRAPRVAGTVATKTVMLPPCGLKPLHEPGHHPRPAKSLNDAVGPWSSLAEVEVAGFLDGHAEIVRVLRIAPQLGVLESRRQELPQDFVRDFMVRARLSMRESHASKASVSWSASEQAPVRRLAQ